MLEPHVQHAQRKVARLLADTAPDSAAAVSASERSLREGMTVPAAGPD